MLFCSDTVIPQNLKKKKKKVQTIVSGSLGQIKYKYIQNFCGVVGSFLIKQACALDPPGLFLCQMSVCLNFGLEKSGHYVQRSVYHIGL